MKKVQKVLKLLNSKINSKDAENLVINLIQNSIKVVEKAFL